MCCSSACELTSNQVALMVTWFRAVGRQINNKVHLNDSFALLVLFVSGRGWQWMCTPHLCPLTTSADMTCWHGSTILCISPTRRSNSSAQVRLKLWFHSGRRVKKKKKSKTAKANCCASVLSRSGILPVHGHVVSGLYPSEEGQISSQAGARIYTQLQSSSGGVQEDECRQSQNTFISHIFLIEVIYCFIFLLRHMELFKHFLFPSSRLFL